MTETKEATPETKPSKVETLPPDPEPNALAVETKPRAIRVKATREGLMGGRTASGYLVDLYVPFVALPSLNAVGKFVRVTNPANGLSTVAWVADVGPWNDLDDKYVFDGARPQAESGKDTRGRKTNGAGIDLGEAVWSALGMKDNSEVDWEFIA